jgi:hypothetical protein
MRTLAPEGHHEDDLARLGTRKPGPERQAGDAARTTPAKDRDAHDRWPKSHFRRHARFDARSCDTSRRNRHDDVNVARGDSCTFKCGARRLHKQFVCALNIDLGALGEIVRRA